MKFEYTDPESDLPTHIHLPNRGRFRIVNGQVHQDYHRPRHPFGIDEMRFKLELDLWPDNPPPPPPPRKRRYSDLGLRRPSASTS